VVILPRNQLGSALGGGPHGAGGNKLVTGHEHLGRREVAAVWCTENKERDGHQGATTQRPRKRRWV